MDIVFMGTPDFAVKALEKLYESGAHNVKAVFTQPDKPKGRGYKLVPPPVKTLALEHGTPVYQPQSLKKEADEYISVLKECAPDCIVVAAYGKLLPKEVLDIPKYGCINIHASLLPEYRGAAPIQRSVLDGKAQTGVTIMQLSEGLDTGDMLLQKAVDIGENATSADMFDILAELGADMQLETLAALENGTAVPVKQDDALATYAHIITKDMCPIDFSKPVFEVHKHICGLSDAPCALCYLNGKRIKVYRSEIISREKTDAQAGEFVGGKRFDVACGEGVIRFTEIQAEGGKRMKAQDYLNGKPVKAGTVLTGEP